MSECMDYDTLHLIREGQEERRQELIAELRNLQDRLEDLAEEEISNNSYNVEEDDPESNEELQLNDENDSEDNYVEDYDVDDDSNETYEYDPDDIEYDYTIPETEKVRYRIQQIKDELDELEDAAV